jgi:Protein of unknown function (DUF1553)/Protein of unknown function (DUF1549)/Planctomycete cytochrome C
MPPLHRASTVLGTALCWLALAGGVGAQVDFNRDIRPILSDKCFKCHGPDAHNRKGKLRLDVRGPAFARRGERGPAIVAGEPDASELVRRILHEDQKKRMPPRKSGKHLDAGEKRMLVAWIAQGARWAEHWAFAPPVVPRLPDVHLATWPTNEIDRLILARLESAGLKPSPATDRRTLIRRVSLDLTGLPPTRPDVAAFLRDRSTNAYEKVIDRLLASPHYGEHMARYWLDAARYGDTHGLHLDNYREMWLYRDWVVKAFQDNMRFDRFTIEQLAGDLLPDPTTAQKIASGFNRCHVTTNEGGSIKEEVFVRNVNDRVATTGTVFLGLTFGCAVCHDHKFDPIPQKEFYQLSAFFNNLDGAAMDGNSKAPAPVLRVPSELQTRQLARFSEDRKRLEAEIQSVLAGIHYEEPTPPEPAETRPRETIIWVDDAFPEGSKAEGDGLAWIETPSEYVHTGRVAMKRQGKGSHQHFFRNATRKLRVGAGDVLFTWVFLDPEDRPLEIMLQWNGDGDKDWNHRAYWGQNKIPSGKDATTQRRRIGDLPRAGEWVKLAVPAAKVGLRPGMAVHGLAFTQFDGTAYWDTAGIETASPQEPEDFIWIDDVAPKGAKLGGNGPKWNWQTATKTRPLVLSGAKSLRRSGKGLIQDYFTSATSPLRVQAGDRLFAHVWLDPHDPPKSVQLQWNDGTWEHRARWGGPAHGPDRKGGANFLAGPLPTTGGWVRLEVPIDAVDLAPARLINGWAFTQVDGTVYWDKAGVRTWGPPDDAHLTSLRAWTAFARDDGAVPAAIRKAIAAPNPTTEQTARIRKHYLRHVHAGSRAVFAPFEKQLANLDKKKQALERKIPTTLVMKERKKPRDAFVLVRGQYHAKGDKVERRTPAVLPPMAKDLPRNRLGLARWLTDPSHPLMARVTVNRFWQQVFGTGLVKTSEDFGNQGERPSHPKLLDWLATRFLADGWDVKTFMKRMVMSATYRQSARVTPALLARDPDNRLLARGPRFRLDAESLRDQALAISGLLVPTIGGPGVKPPQPAGLWRAVGYTSSNTAKFKADTGVAKVHRRSIYTFWKRTSPPPQMTTFDAPSREDCRVRRERTNSPMQALLMMNETQYVEAARALAQLTLTAGGTDDTVRASWMFQTATCRAPARADLTDLLRLLAAQRAEFHENPKAAGALIVIGETKADARLDPGELASWTVVANLILNLDEVVTK